MKAAYLIPPQPLRIRDIRLTLKRATRAYIGTMLRSPKLTSRHLCAMAG